MYSAPDGEPGNFRPTVAVVDLEAFRTNIRSVRSKLPDDARLVAVLKADAYGHGALQLATVAQDEKVAMIAVALLEEAVDLRRHGIDLPILCLGPIYGDAFRVAEEYDVTPGISDPIALGEIAELARVRGITRIHLKLDSGMGRMGLIDSDLDDAIELIDDSPLQVSGIYSHFSNASSPEDPLNELQVRRFREMLDRLGDAGIEAPLHHFANSAGIFAGMTEPGSWARAGIALYGGNPLDQGEVDLEPVLSWKTAIQRLKWLDEGEVVGYGGAFVTERRTHVATLPVGYGDGYSRLLSNRGDVLIRGKRCPVIGRVSMDLVTVDVSSLDEVEHGDEVVLLGKQGEEIITAEEIAEKIDTINYEVFTSISARVPRRWVSSE